MKLSAFFSYASAVGWLISSILWTISARIKFKSQLPEFTGPAFKGKTQINPTPNLIGVWVDGKPQTSSADIARYTIASGKWNSIAAAVSAISAILSAVATFFSA